MFFSEFGPILKEVSQQPIAFLGGFVSGLLRLDLADDPVKSWLDGQAGSTVRTTSSTTHDGKGPQSISID
jgi:hypothetical protein